VPTRVSASDRQSRQLPPDLHGGAVQAPAATQDVRYRFITELNTQVRRLAIVSAIVRHVVNGQLVSHAHALQRLFEWSGRQEGHVADYKRVTGKVTLHGNGRPSAAKRYFAFAEALGLIVKLPGAYQIGRDGAALLELARQDVDRGFALSSYQKLFFLRLLLEHDADGLVSVLNMLRQRPSVHMKDLLESFHMIFLARLETKVEFTKHEPTRVMLLQRRSEMLHIWRSPRRYAEHIVPPRLHWLRDIGFVDGEPKYHLTSFGEQFYDALPQIDSETRDVDDTWLDVAFSKTAGGLLLKTAAPRTPMHLTKRVRRKRIGKIVTDSFALFSSQVPPKASLRQVLLYTTIRLAVDEGLFAEVNDLLETLKTEPLVIKGRRLQAVLSARSEESYLMLL